MNITNCTDYVDFLQLRKAPPENAGIEKLAVLQKEWNNDVVILVNSTTGSIVYRIENATKEDAGIYTVVAIFLDSEQILTTTQVIVDGDTGGGEPTDPPPTTTTGPGDGKHVYRCTSAGYPSLVGFKERVSRLGAFIRVTWTQEENSKVSCSDTVNQ